MSETRDERSTQPSMLMRADEIQEQIQQISGRDLQLWSIIILIVLVLTAGLLALIVPNLVWAQREDSGLVEESRHDRDQA